MLRMQVLIAIASIDLTDQCMFGSVQFTRSNVYSWSKNAGMVTSLPDLVCNVVL